VPLSSADGLHCGLREAFEVWGFTATLVGAVAVLEVDARPLGPPDGPTPMLISDADGVRDVHGCFTDEDLPDGGRRMTFVTSAAEAGASQYWLWRDGSAAVGLGTPTVEMAFVQTGAAGAGEDAPAEPARFESVFDREAFETGGFEPPADAWPADERTGGFAVLDLRQLRANVQRQHLPALLALAAAFIAFLLVAFTGFGPHAF